MIPLVILLSFILEIFFSNIISLSSIFIPLFLIVSLVLIYPYFKSKVSYIIVFSICGLIYDLGFLNTIFVNTICFTFMGFATIYLHSYINYNFISSNLVSILIIVLYRIINYLLLCLTAYTDFNVHVLLQGIYSSLLMNIIYGVLLYLILEFICRQFNIKKNE